VRPRQDTQIAKLVEIAANGLGGDLEPDGQILYRDLADGTRQGDDSVLTVIELLHRRSPFRQISCLLFRFDRLWFIFSSIANKFAERANAKGGSRGCFSGAIQSAGADKSGAGFLLPRAPRRRLVCAGAPARSFLPHLTL
jgi:hypothetical protein